MKSAYQIRKGWDDQLEAAKILQTAGMPLDRIANVVLQPLLSLKKSLQIDFKTSDAEMEFLKELHWQDWFVAGSDVTGRELVPRKVLLKDAETGAPVLFAASINMLWAFRGQGKSIVANALMRTLVTGTPWLRFASPGGTGVLLVDGELPAKQLQERLQEFSGGSFRVLSPEFMALPEEFPNLSDPEAQATFLDRLECAADQGEKIDVLIFDTLTRCFRFDTNDSDAWLVVNDFLITLRSKGYCVVLIHHAGKSGTQRGRTDADDNLDVSIKLEAPYGWQAGDGLAFKWVYEKVRHGGTLPDFEAAYTDGAWALTQDDRIAEVVALAAEGKPTRAIGTQLDMSQSTVSRLLRKAKASNLLKLNTRALVSE